MNSAKSLLFPFFLFFLFSLSFSSIPEDSDGGLGRKRQPQVGGGTEPSPRTARVSDEGLEVFASRRRRRWWKGRRGDVYISRARVGAEVSQKERGCRRARGEGREGGGAAAAGVLGEKGWPVDGRRSVGGRAAQRGWPAKGGWGGMACEGWVVGGRRGEGWLVRSRRRGVGGGRAARPGGERTWGGGRGVR
ncbi:hypothetical protein PVAP13_2NG623766 [Panicum virgatum]|uniref:Uncharacterized protein n=1 Tax=Panicum virgatum TaxID=38727 RepID=A0A8T0VZ26_PANVG|nr:hypothetical protein PVAP13_2NG623766 [Panicum virgatum]